jgi:tripartite-type tricarboxylate transporter receptor subunit TctC
MAGGLQITHVPYKGTAPALADLLAGQVELMFDNLGVSLPQVKEGKLKALAVASSKRFRSLPDVPAMAEMADPLGMNAAETAAFMKQETERWGAVIRSAGVKVE